MRRRSTRPAPHRRLSENRRYLREGYDILSPSRVLDPFHDGSPALEYEGRNDYFVCAGSDFFSNRTCVQFSGEPYYVDDSTAEDGMMEPTAYVDSYIRFCRDNEEAIDIATDIAYDIKSGASEREIVRRYNLISADD